ncbi:hypothetical protein [Myroides indicus]|uniref:Uncharacterized protein n=1 Tax=Myroides indicus TaxID=1323422 RepID=A0A4R7ESK2_9FLAO|nr:hypothetical protein [Myroides indicus]TDS52416.1 hypothetical protein C8P70_1317 [Myroides indicus]
MKKILLFILATITISCNSQEKIDFKVGYLPNLDYTLSQKQISENTIKYIASDEVLQSLKDRGVENPTVKKDTTILKSISKTGRIEGNAFPVNIELLESTNPTLLSGTKFFGKYIDQKIRIDSIFSTTMTNEEKMTLRMTMESMLNQVEYPNRKIKVGESFKQNNPISMPIGNIVIELDINSTYTLTNISDGIGYFNLDQIYTLKTEIENYEIKVNGKGNGQIQYDIEQQFFTKYFLEMEMNLKMDLDPFSIELQTKSITDQTTEIKKASKSNHNNQAFLLLKNSPNQPIRDYVNIMADMHKFHNQTWISFTKSNPLSA